MIYSTLNGKESVRSPELRVVGSLELSTHHRVEHIIYDRSVAQLEEVRKEIVNIKPVQFYAPSPQLIDVYGSMSDNQWTNMFNSRKERMLF